MSFPDLYILRHGQTEWNAEHRVQGGLDSPLTARGREEAARQRALLATCDLTGFRALTSPQGRAVQTAAIALTGLVPAIHTDPRLAEIRVGDWEGLRRDALPGVTATDEREESALALYDLAPRGEGLAALRRRCEAFLSDLDGPAILVTHGITSRMLRLVWLDQPTEQIAALPGGQGVVFHLSDGQHRSLG